MVAALAATALVIAAVAWWAREDGAAGDPAAVVRGGRGPAATGAPDLGSVDEATALLDQERRAELAAAAGAVPEDADPRLLQEREVTGTVVTADGSRLPDDLLAYASLVRPYPRLTRLKAIAGGNRPSDRDAAAPGVPDEEIVARTEAPVAADGSFRLARVPGHGGFVGIRHAEWYATESVHLDPGLARPVQVVVARGGRIVGRVADAADNPLAGVEVSAGSPFDPYAMFGEGVSFVHIAPAETDAEGRFALDQVPPGVELLVRARDDEHAPAKVKTGALAPHEVREMALVLRRGAEVRGRVVDGDGAPRPDQDVVLARASFTITEIDTDDEQMEVDRRTGADGSFAFTAVPPGSYTLALRSSRFRPARTDAFDLVHGQVLDDLRIVAEEGLRVAGAVLDSDDAPVAGARVHGAIPVNMTNWWAGVDAAIREPVHTDDEGRFAIGGFDPGPVELRVNAAGFRPLKLTVAAGDEALVVPLDRNVTVSGIVVSLVDGEPVTSFSVELMPAGGVFSLGDMMNVDQRLERIVRPRRFESEIGEFELRDVQSGSYDLTVRAEGFGEAKVTPVAVEDDRDTKGIVVMLAAECAVTGLVVDAATNLPLPGATVTTSAGGILDEIGSTIAGGVLETSTGPDGRFRLGGLTPDDLRITVKHREHLDLRVPDLALAAGETLDLGVLRLAAGSVIEGHVYDETDRPVPGVPVLVSEAVGRSIKRLTTDGVGFYRAQGLPAGTYNVMRLDFDMSFGGGDMSGFMDDLQYEVVQLGADEVREVDLRVAGGGVTLQGTVRDADGRGIASMVTLTPESGMAGFELASSDDVGRFELKNVEPGRYTLNAMPMDGMGMATSGQPQPGAIESLTVTAEPVQRHDVTVGGGRLEIVTVDARGGAAATGVRVLLERIDPGRPDLPLMERLGWRVGENYTGEDGRVSFKYLADGEYTVVAGGRNIIGMGAGEWASRRVEGVAVRAGDPGFPVRIELTRGGVIAGTVLGADGQPLADCPVWAKGPGGDWQSPFSEVGTDTTGRFRLEGLAEGLWTIALRHDAHALQLQDGVRVRAGEETPLQVRLERGPRVLVEPAGRNPLALDVRVTGPYGEVPTGLIDLGDIVGGFAPEGRVDLGRLLPGAYHLQVWERGTLVLETDVELSMARDPEVVSLADA